MEEFKKLQGIKLTTKMKKKTTKPAPKRYSPFLPPQQVMYFLIDLSILALLVSCASALIVLTMQLFEKITITVTRF